MSFGLQKKVSVILSVKDGARFLREAIESILQQTYQNVEFILINDGSRDETDTLIRSYTDPRIVYIAHSSSLGLATRLNEAMTFVTGDYVARMDADDIALPTRLEKQVSFLETQPTIDLVGTWAVSMDEQGNVSDMLYRTPVTQIEILFRACFANPFIHPTMMMRTTLLKMNPYDESYARSQDFELWSRLLFREKVRAANIPEPLLYYRRHTASSTRQKHPDEYIRSAEVALKNGREFYPSTSQEQALFIKAYSAQRLTAREILVRMRFGFRLWKGFITRYPEAKEAIQFAPWKDVYFFTKYWIKQVIRSKKYTRAMPSEE